MYPNLNPPSSEDEENLYLDWVSEQEEIKRQIQFQEDMEYMDWAFVNGTILE